MGLGAYEFMRRSGIKDELKWPEMLMNEILEIAFKNKIIDRLDHFVLCNCAEKSELPARETIPADLVCRL